MNTSQELGRLAIFVGTELLIETINSLDVLGKTIVNPWRTLSKPRKRPLQMAATAAENVI